MQLLSVQIDFFEPMPADRNNKRNLPLASEWRSSKAVVEATERKEKGDCWIKAKLSIGSARNGIRDGLELWAQEIRGLLHQDC
jgi:hypothetical protein